MQWLFNIKWAEVYVRVLNMFTNTKSVETGLSLWVNILIAIINRIETCSGESRYILPWKRPQTTPPNKTWTSIRMERKKRVTRMVAIVVLLFAVCWCPIHFVAMWYQFDPNFPKTDAMHYFKLFGHTLSYANSCVNPFVYAFSLLQLCQSYLFHPSLISVEGHICTIYWGEEIV
jgi:hypothetical protein